MKKVAIIGTVGIPACYGGYETLAENLVRRLHDQFELTVYCSRRAYKVRPASWMGARLKYLPLNANGLSCLLYDTLSALDAVRYADVLLLLGPNAIWILAVLRMLGMRKPIISNIDGLESSREKFNFILKAYCGFLEATTARFSNAVIADNQVIFDHVQAHYPRSNCRLIEYGADHCASRPVDDAAREKYPFLSGSYVFSVCRIEKENNVQMTLEAFLPLEIPLVIVGNWNKSEYSQELRKKYADVPHFQLLDPIFDLKQLDVLRSNCRIYIHGHHCGGTNPSLVEAMHLGRSIFAFDVNFNHETTENRAKYYSSVEELRELARNTGENELNEIGAAMEEIATRRYTWNRIVSLYANEFDQERIK